MAFPAVSHCLIIKKIPDEPNLCKIIDVLHNGEEYVVEKKLANYARSLDGKTSPYQVPGYSKAEARWMLAFLKENDLIRNRYVNIEEGLVSLSILRLKKRPPVPVKVLAFLFNCGLLLSWLPVLFAGIFVYCRRGAFEAMVWSPFLGTLVGIVPGVILHEAGHALAGIASGGRLFELGLFWRYIFPGAYTVVYYSEEMPRWKRFQINAAGVEMNSLLVGVFLLLSVHCTQDSIGAVLFYAAFINAILALVNIALLQGLDGAHMVEALSGFNLVGNSREMLSNIAIRTKLSQQRGLAGKTILAVDTVFVILQYAYIAAIFIGVNIFAWKIS